MSTNLNIEEPLNYDESVPTSPLLPKPFSGKWFDLNHSMALLALGQPRSGKGKLLDYFFELTWRAHFLQIWLHSALGGENLFTPINKNCGKRIEKEISEKPNKAHELPACKCYEPIPSIWIKPDYLEIKKTPKEKIKIVFKDWNEYHQAYLKNIVKEYIPQWEWRYLVDNDKVPEKPKSMLPVPKDALLKIMDITPTQEPMDGKGNIKNYDEFTSQLYKIIKIAKKENRPILSTPGIYPSTNIGKIEKYSVIASTCSYLQYELCNDPIMRVVPRKTDVELSDKDKSNHKIALFFNELRACAPSEKYMGEKQSTISKRRIFNLMPERRHIPVWVFGDSQDPMDIHGPVRAQFSQFVVFKRITYELAGADFRDFFNIVDKAYIEALPEMVNPKKVPDEVRLNLLYQRGLSRLPELPDNFYCVKLPTGGFRILPVAHACFHHKDDTVDNVWELLGLEQPNVSDQKKEEMLLTSTKKKTIKIDEDEEYNKLMQIIHEKLSSGEYKSIQSVYDNLNELTTHDKFLSWSKGTLGNHYTQYKQNLSKSE